MHKQPSFYSQPLSAANSIAVLLVMTALISNPVSIHAQADSLATSFDIIPFDRAHVYFVGTVAVPSPELRKALNNNFGNLGVGIAGGVLLNPFGSKQSSPFLIGIEGGYLTYGVDKIAKTNYSPPLKTSFNVYSVHATGRLLLKQEPGFAPFIDGLVGAKIFNTRTKVDKDAIDFVLNDNTPEVINTTNDTSLSYGAGLGFFMRKPPAGPNKPRASFMVRILYMWGADATYVVRDSVTIDSSNTLHYQTATTSTSMWLVNIGFVLY
jgi:hypothetical protein